MKLNEGCYYYLQSFLYLDGNLALEISNSKASTFQFLNNEIEESSVKSESLIFVLSPLVKPHSIIFTYATRHAPNGGAGSVIELV